LKQDNDTFQDAQDSTDSSTSKLVVHGGELTPPADGDESKVNDHQTVHEVDDMPTPPIEESATEQTKEGAIESIPEAAEPSATEDKAVEDTQTEQDASKDAKAPNDLGITGAGDNEAESGEGKSSYLNTHSTLHETDYVVVGSIPILAPDLPAREAAPLRGLSGDLPPMTHPPPPTNPVRPPRPVERASRKVSNPFAWLSRATSIRGPSTSPQRPTGTNGRRSTMSSMVSVGSTQDALGTVEEGGASQERRQSRYTLKDRFQLLRMESEAGPLTEAGHVQEPQMERSQSVQELPTDSTEQTRPPLNESVSSPGTKNTVSSKLPPGTVAGTASAPDEEPVNWDLWQELVYDGPVAVVQSNGHALKRAIAKGIPQPIRGVAWQVLGQSKNEDLERLYFDLVAKGTDNENTQTPATSQIDPTSTGQANGEEEKEAFKDSTETPEIDVTSGESTPVQSAMQSPNPEHEHDMESVHTAAESIATTRQSSVFDDSNAMKKLEKSIRKDLGGRTSFSKYLVSAGLQEGLFGVCKAYALYDEEIGYAQGMNFLVMPLLFNVIHSLPGFSKLMLTYPDARRGGFHHVCPADVQLRSTLPIHPRDVRTTSPPLPVRTSSRRL